MSDSAQSLWPQAGYAQLKKDARGHLTVTDDFLRVLLLRPELAPIESSCKHEIQIHERLLENPRLDLQDADLAPVEDRDAADNMAVWLRFRNRILARPTLEASYWALFEGQGVDVPPVLVHQITQVLVQHILTDDCTPIEARAAELLFRTQKISVLDDGSVMAADHETVERHALESGLDDFAHDSGVNFRCHHRRWRIRAHTACVGALVVVQQTLVVLRSGQRYRHQTMRHHHEAGFFAV